MAYLHIGLSSECLRGTTDVNVLLPESGKRSYPTLWLLHGMSGNYSDWLRRTSVERYAEAAEIAVVMPSAENSYYEDMAHGARYYSYVTEELPAKLGAMLPLSSDPAETYVAGLSMGGYGAMKLALRHPERYAAAASFSGVLDLAAREMQNIFPDIFFENFGERSLAGTDADLFALLRRHVSEGTPLPKLYIWCGRQDTLLPHNERFRDLCTELRVPLSYRTAPGAHEWGFWDMAVREFIELIRR